VEVEFDLGIVAVADLPIFLVDDDVDVDLVAFTEATFEIGAEGTFEGLDFLRDVAFVFNDDEFDFTAELDLDLLLGLFALVTVEGCACACACACP